MYDLIIIGAGPAGITAAVYAARKKLSLLVITKDIGGQAAWSSDIENYTGYQFITGPDLAAKFEDHMRAFSLALKEGEAVTKLAKHNDQILVKTNKADYEAKAVIIASGKRSKELKVPGEQQFKNRGLTYCATCDGPLFSGKDVAVIGGGNSALDAVLQLIRIARQVYVINATAELGGDTVMREKVMESSVVTVFNNTSVAAILGEKMASAIKIQRGAKEEVIPVQGIFVEIGLMPNSEFANDIDKNQFEEIKINYRNETNIPGIFAAGDVTDVPEIQIIIAAGEGAKAALGVFKYLSGRRF
jgi:alkyl hydroperoxide reductase subunit F